MDIKGILWTALAVVVALVVYDMVVKKALKLSYEESYDAYDFETL
jgi:hypothetical protein